MCGGGGGGDGGAAQREADRQKRIKEATNAINNIFATGNRQALYDQQRQAVFDVNNLEINKQYEDARRNNDYALARRGQLGGGLDIKTNAEIDRATNQARIRAQAAAEDSAAQLSAADERTRQALTSQALSGVDANAVTQEALGQMSANTALAKSAATANTVGDIFGGLANAWLWNKQQEAQQQAYKRALARYSTLPAVNNGTILK